MASLSRLLHQKAFALVYLYSRSIFQSFFHSPTSQGIQYLFILGLWSMPHGWTNTAAPSSSAAANTHCSSGASRSHTSPGSGCWRSQFHRLMWEPISTPGKPSSYMWHIYMYIHVVNEGKQARSNKQTRQSNTAYPRQSLFLRKMSYLGWDSNPRHAERSTTVHRDGTVRVKTKVTQLYDNFFQITFVYKGKFMGAIANNCDFCQKYCKSIAFVSDSTL